MSADGAPSIERPPGGAAATIWSKASVLGTLIAALVVAELTKDVVFARQLGEWHPACVSLWGALIAGLPFLLARMAPKAAAFDTQWLPRSRWHWLWFVGMVLLLLGSSALLNGWIATNKELLLRWSRVGSVTPAGIIVEGMAAVVVLPVAEEIFFRGYVLDQLQKVMRGRYAVVLQAVLFGLAHVYTRASLPWFAALNFGYTFVFGMMAGLWRIRLRSLLPLVLAHMIVNALAFGYPLKHRYDWVMAERHLTSHSISRETTYLTGPLRKDGGVDYVAELNRRASQGVTPDNNASVLFWQAVGPEEIQPEFRDRFFQMLGIPPLPEKGDYFVNLQEYLEYLANEKDGAESGGAEPKSSPDEAYDLLEQLRDRSWSKKEFPAVAAWLAANERPLALVVEASKRPRRYDPLVCGEKTSPMSVPLPANSVLHQPGDVIESLIVRGMFRLGEGKISEAWDDLLACHRLARLVGQGQTTVEAVVAFSTESTAFDGDAAFLQHASLTAIQAARMRADLERLPPMPRMADRLDSSERFTYLSIVSESSRHGLSSLQPFVASGMGDLLFGDGDLALAPKGIQDTIRSLLRYGDDTDVDWDLVLRRGNAWFDRLVDAYRKPTCAERREAMARFGEDFRKLKEQAADASSLDKAMLDNPRVALSERTSQVLLILFVPDPTHYSEIEDRCAMRFELARLGFALAGYRADHGAYPAALAGLAPSYIAEVPRDMFNDAELHYQLEGGGCLVYSVGVNGKDDGAKGYQDRKEDYDTVDWDDVALRLPAP